MDCLNEHDYAFIERFLLSFKVLNGKSDGLIDLELFKSYLDKVGSSQKDILQLIKEEQCVSNIQLDFFQLCASILAVKASLNIFSLENGPTKCTNAPINTLTYTRKKNSSQASVSKGCAHEEPASEIFMQEISGSVYNVDKDMLSNQYSLEVFQDCWIELFAKPTKDHGDLNVPLEILVFQDKSQTAFISSSCINSEGFNSVRHRFSKGKYLIVPIFFNWLEGRDELDEKVTLSHLFSVDFIHVMSTACVEALHSVFDAIDLDKNGLLSQLEFDFFVQHTSGETAADEWSTIEDNLTMKDNELTFEGFLELYRMVIQTDPEDMVHMFHRMGMNHLLEQKHAEPFTLFIRSESSKFLLNPLPVQSYRLMAEKSLCKMAVEQGISKKVKNMNDLVLYTLELPHRVTIVIQNQSHSKVKVRLNCTQSVNCRSHRSGSDFTAVVPPRSTVVGHHLVPHWFKKFWNSKCVDELL